MLTSACVSCEKQFYSERLKSPVKMLKMMNVQKNFITQIFFYLNGTETCAALGLIIQKTTYLKVISKGLLQICLSTAVLSSQQLDLGQGQMI